MQFDQYNVKGCSYSITSGISGLDFQAPPLADAGAQRWAKTPILHWAVMPDAAIAYEERDDTMNPNACDEGYSAPSDICP